MTKVNKFIKCTTAFLMTMTVISIADAAKYERSQIEGMLPMMNSQVKKSQMADSLVKVKNIRMGDEGASLIFTAEIDNEMVEVYKNRDNAELTCKEYASADPNLTTLDNYDYLGYEFFDADGNLLSSVKIDKDVCMDALKKMNVGILDANGKYTRDYIETEIVATHLKNLPMMNSFLQRFGMKYTNVRVGEGASYVMDVEVMSEDLANELKANSQDSKMFEEMLRRTACQNPATVNQLSHLDFYENDYYSFEHKDGDKPLAIFKVTYKDCL